MPRYSDLLPYQPLPGRGGRLSDLSRQELNAYVDQVAPDAALRFGNMARADYPYSMDGQGMRQALEGELQRMDKGTQGQTLDQAAVATAGVPILGDAVGLAADAKAVYDDPSWLNIGGAALGALPFVPAMAAIRAYHGSPHDFDKFDLSKIGTGEGAQAYGHGLYFAEAEDTARSYRDTLSSDKSFSVANTEIPSWVARRVTGYDPVHSPDARSVADYTKLNETIKDFENRLEQSLAEKAAGDWNAGMRAEAQQKILDGLYAMAGGARINLPGRMYEVNINADPEDFLDWDRPLSGQPSGFYAAMKDQEKRFAIVTPDGKFATNTPLTKDDATEFIADFRRGYSRSGRDPNDWRIADYSDPSSLPDLPLPEAFGVRDRAAVDRLAAAGIPGIKYLDQGSRAAGEGSRNYVVFDDALVEIIRKYGLAAVLGGTGAFGLMSLQGGEDGTQPPL